MILISVTEEEALTGVDVGVALGLSVGETDRAAVAVTEVRLSPSYLETNIQ